MTFNDPKLNQQLYDAERAAQELLKQVQITKPRKPRQLVIKRADYKDYRFTVDNPNPNWS